ncbi:hypothetical protein. In SS9 not in 3TCK. very small protein of 49 aa [Photobacterium kishitanii]|nr:hypothetical protein. In SS9 not in 3TCK. very small protein of 49 aa [Photobacterium kishitanii]
MNLGLLLPFDNYSSITPLTTEYNCHHNDFSLTEVKHTLRQIITKKKRHL